MKLGSIGLDNGTFVTAYAFSMMSIYPNIITIENQFSPSDYTILGQGFLSYNIGLNSQQLLFPASLSTGIKAITLPNDTGTVALTYNTATTGSNQFTGSQGITGSLIINNGALMNSDNISAPFTVPVGYNALLVGPISNNNLITVLGQLTIL